MRNLLVAVMMALASPVLAQTATPGTVLDAAVEQVIRPGMAAFETSAEGLETAMGALCAGLGASRLVTNLGT